MKLTLKKINDRIADIGYELVRGCGYFYFHPLHKSVPMLDDSMVMVYRLNDMDTEQWVDVLQAKILDCV